MSRFRLSAVTTALFFAFATGSGAIAQEIQGGAGGSADMEGQQQQQPLSANPLTEGEVRRLITTYGYSEVEDLEKQGNEYTATAKKDDERIEVVVNAKTGAVREAGS